MPPKQTKRAALPTRYFAGKPVGKEEVDEFSSSDEEQQDRTQAASKNEQRSTTNSAPILALKNVNLDEKFEKEKQLEQERVALIEEADALADEEEDEESDEEEVRLPPQKSRTIWR